MKQHRYSKQEAINIVISCAKKYQDELNNRSLLLICSDKHKKVEAIELTFKSQNFMHLTGLKANGRGNNGDGIIASYGEEVTANVFYKRCLDNMLSPDDFEFSDDETTHKKLDVLPHIISKNLCANMVGDYNGKRPRLITKKIVGNINACIGFVRNEYGELVPNTILKEDVRDNVNLPLRILAVFRKEKSETEYKEITYLAKKADWDRLFFPREYKNYRQLIKEGGLRG